MVGEKPGGWYRVTKERTARNSEGEFYMQRVGPVQHLRDNCVFYDLTKLTKLISKTKNNIRGVPILVRGGLADYGKENVLEETIDKNSFRKILTNYFSR